MNKHLGIAAFALGAAAVGWVASGYAGNNLPALAMTLAIGVVYLLGGLELRRFHQATAGLQQGLQGLTAPPPDLSAWLAQVPAPLRNAVRLRVEGERQGLPGPAMTPYLVGLLVLLGMLGTFIGMVVTLHGAVQALESTADLATIRAALAAPVKGLGLAFGTSVAGVAASAMLGLVSALCRRERLQAGQLLDGCIATHLRGFTLAHQREQTLQTLQQQAQALPAVAQTLQAVAAQMERHSQALHTQLLAGQDRFHHGAQTAFEALAASVDQTLQRSLSDSARAAGAALQPAVQAAMAGIAQETAQFQQHLAGSVQGQLDAVTARLDGAVAAVAGGWRDTLAQQQDHGREQAATLQAALAAVVQRIEAQAGTLLQTVDRSQAALLAEVAAAERQRVADTAAAERQRLAETTAREQQRLADAAAADQQRLAAWTQSLDAVTATLQQGWQQAGAQQLAQQRQICATLEQTAQAVQAGAEAHARSTIAEMARLIDAASEAPRAAAAVVGQLRQQLSDSMVRDTALLDERARLLETLSTLLDAVNHGAREQRAAIDTLVAGSATLLQQAGERFTGAIAAETTTMAAAAAQLTGSAVDMASLGEAFGVAVQQFGTSSQALTAQLQRIEAALDKSGARSDEQLAYYVAQAREIIELSISSQKQIVDDLQQIARRPAPLADAVA